MAVLGGKPLAPFANDSGLNPLLNMVLKFWFTHGEKLCAMIERCIANATRSQTTTWAFAFVQHHNFVSVVV
jgi:hypothetical protein